MREEDKGGEAVGAGVWIREGFTEEVAGSVLLSAPLLTHSAKIQKL